MVEARGTSNDRPASRRGFIPPRWTPPPPKPEQVAAWERRWFPIRFPHVVALHSVALCLALLFGMGLLLLMTLGLYGAPVRAGELLGVALILSLLIAAVARLQRIVHHRIARALSRRCVQCGYDIRVTLDRCPECGHHLGC